MSRGADPRVGAAPRNEDKIVAVLRDAAPLALGVEEIEKRAGVKAVSVYLSHLTRRDPPLAVRVGRGMYRASTGSDAAYKEALAIVEADRASAVDLAADDIRAAERRRIAGELAAALSDAVPKEAQDYINGFRDGANFIAQRVLGLTLPEEEPTHA